MERVNKKELILKLVTNFLDKKEYLDSETRKALIDVASEIYNKDLKELYDINKYIVEKKESFEGHNISYVFKDDKYTFIVDGNMLELNLQQIKEIIRGLIDILEDTLPLGTVVKLKKEYLKEAINNTEIEEAEFVIVNRFVFRSGVKIFMPYSGIVYPVGFVGNADALHFTPSWIEEVVHRGYSDDKEDAYTYLLII